MRVMLRFRWLIVAILVSFVAVACGEDGPAAAGDGSAVRLPSSPTELPDFDVAAYETLVEGLRGTPLVVNVWASWCGPCRVEAPALAEVATAYGDRVQFLGVAVLDTRPDARAFIEEFGWPYPSVFDRTGAIRDRLGLLGQPATIIYDAVGGVVDTYVGAISEDQLTQQLEALLAG
jgi:cytochrome c biogenesis protein CcmG/thiol:disulfide interchange protein DsbE